MSSVYYDHKGSLRDRPPGFPKNGRGASICPAVDLPRAWAATLATAPP